MPSVLCARAFVVVSADVCECASFCPRKCDSWNQRIRNVRHSVCTPIVQWEWKVLYYAPWNRDENGTKTIQSMYCHVLGKSVCNLCEMKERMHFSNWFFTWKKAFHRLFLASVEIGKDCVFSMHSKGERHGRKTAKSPEDFDRVIDNCQHIITILRWSVEFTRTDWKRRPHHHYHQFLTDFVDNHTYCIIEDRNAIKTCYDKIQRF